MFLSLVIVVPISVHAGFFSKLFNNTEVIASTLAPEATQSGIDVPLLTAQQNPNPMAARGGAEIIVEDNVLVSTGPVGDDVIAEQKSSLGEIRVYTVREGDSLSQVADMFGVTTNTIMWANDLTKATAIQPGDSLVILPIAGVRHVVKKGDTMSTIAKKYDGDQEEEADLFGATLLLPREALLHIAKLKLGLDEVKKDYKVSKDLFSMRMARTGVNKQLTYRRKPLA